PAPGGAPRPTRHLAELARQADAHLARLATRLANTTDPQIYRTFATQVALAGWLPPGTSRLAGDIASVAAVLTDHELLTDGTCRCGWQHHHGVVIEPGQLWHPEHVARHLLDEAAIT
ncbi:MAG: hypothetical protein L0H84_15165, partial [Pseudonocardia sp.]|nr:hypothetical protein [Pseudonocardia sp.]